MKKLSRAKKKKFESDVVIQNFLIYLNRLSVKLRSLNSKDDLYVDMQEIGYYQVPILSYFTDLENDKYASLLVSLFELISTTLVELAKSQKINVKNAHQLKLLIDDFLYITRDFTETQTNIDIYCEDSLSSEDLATFLNLLSELYFCDTGKRLTMSGIQNISVNQKFEVLA